MSLRPPFARSFGFALLVSGLLLQSPRASMAQATSTGSIVLQVMDSTKAALPATRLVLIDKSTNVTRIADTLKTGSYIFQALPYGHYQLTVTHEGFQATVYDDIVVQAGRDTGVNATLAVGVVADKVEVSSLSVPVIETQSNTLSTSLDLKQVLNLPVIGRDLVQLSYLAPGYAHSGTDTGAGSADGSFNGTAGSAFQANIDGVNATSSRFKTGYANLSAVSPRVENIQEFTIQTGELDPSQGAGQSAVQTLFVTNRGTNRFHGRLYLDHQNGGLNANTWTNNAYHVKRSKLVLNDFGASVGGPIWKNRLFFFGSYSQSILPSSQLLQATVPTAAAAAGLYTYYTNCGSSSCPTATLNVLTAAQQGGYSAAINSVVAAQLAKNAGTYKYGTLVSNASDLNHQTLSWTQPIRTTRYYPSGRLDYTLNSTNQLNLSFNYSKTTNTGQFASKYPGPDFANQTSGYASSRYVVSLGEDWTIKPTLLNQLRLGFLYNKSIYSPEALGYDLSAMSNQGWSFGVESGVAAVTSQSSFYPYLTLSDNVNWQKGSHSIKFGGNVFREQDHYWNPPVGYPNYTLGVTDLDPVGTPLLNSIPQSGTSAPSNLTQVQGDVKDLYALLNGRINYVGAIRPYNSKTGNYDAYGAFNLDEVLLGGGIYVMDTWRALPSLTFNYGLRWDFIGDDYDRNSAYTGPDVSSLWGPSGVGNLFQPGVLTGNLNPTYQARSHSYKSSLVNPEPQVGMAWNPSRGDTWYGRLLGNGKSVIRGSFTLKNYTEGGQNFWQYASNGGFNFFQNAKLYSDTSGLAGHFTPGSLTLGQSLPSYSLTPATFQKTINMSDLTFNNGPAFAMNPNIRQPYVESWTLGYQRQLSNSSAIEVRYVGNHSVHQWLSEDINQVNIAESGFLSEFKAAQTNLAVNTAAGNSGDFENHGGGKDTPILTQAFGGAGAPDFTNGTFATLLQQGAAGAFATQIVQNPSYYCNLVGQQFAPCAGITTVQNSAYPINLFQANPYAEGQQAFLLDSKGSSNYHSLQTELRQQIAHGLELNANYTYSKSLGIAQQRSIWSFGNFYDLHNKRLNYMPSAFDIRHTLHVSGTYDLPLGRGHALLSGNRVENLLAGGWTVGSIVQYQSGAPSLLTGGYNTVNSSVDGGVDFAGGASASTIQHSVHITRSPGNPYVNFLGKKFQGTSSANFSYVNPHTDPGTFGHLNYIYGPKWINTDIAVTKNIPIREGILMNLQGEFLNAFNHPAFLVGDTGVQDSTFGTTATLGNSPRHIELRANITF